MPTTDVSQFIQMNRLRSLESRTPTKSDRSLVEFYQPSFLVPNNKFLPNSNTKFTHSSTIQRFPLYKGIQAKYKIPTRNAWGGTIVSRYSFNLYAGTVGSSGNLSSQFTTPEDVYASTNGDLYVVTGGDRRIRFYNSTTKLISTLNLTPLAGSPLGIVPYLGIFYFTDSTNNQIKEMNSNGSGISPFTPSLSSISAPKKLVIDSNNFLYVVSRGNFTIKKINLQNAVSFTTIIGNGLFQGASPGAQNLKTPVSATSISMGQLEGICIDSSGNIYVSDSSANRILKYETLTSQIRLFAGNDNPLNGPNQGFIDGSAYTARFEGPNGLTVDASDNIYVADYFNSAIRKITPSGDVSTLNTGGWSLGRPSGVYCDKINNILYVADTTLSAIFKITLL